MYWNCQKPRHFKNDCKNLNKEGNNSTNTITEAVNDTLLLAIHINVDDWVLDLGVSFHTTLHQKIMTNYVANDFGKVYLIDEQSLDVVGLRDVSIKQPNDSVWILQKVTHIPRLKKNLIFVDQLDDSGHFESFKNGE